MTSLLLPLVICLFRVWVARHYSSHIMNPPSAPLSHQTIDRDTVRTVLTNPPPGLSEPKFVEISEQQPTRTITFDIEDLLIAADLRPDRQRSTTTEEC
ncbi:hypothetical protein DPEC_G00029170 [Dallia pectoralis]|uniref:Uncharacterized protein n=1 Tax=Dallia pectoralis TaxID=75939 RepID=A0ACC2HJS4_DALPE|nr:hypothetical protein DPEC_G00029170 [Dallia pectoralis]